jgi:hypothetical protein
MQSASQILNVLNGVFGPRRLRLPSGKQIFRKILTTASGHHIPAGFRKDFVPGLPRAAVNLNKEQDGLRVLDPLDPRIQDLNQRITECVTTEAKKKWQEEVEASKPRSNPENFLRLLRNLSGKHKHQPPNQPIKFGTTSFSKSQVIANRFCKQYSNMSTHKQNPQACHVNRKLKMKHPLDPSFKPAMPNMSIAID